MKSRGIASSYFMLRLENQACSIVQNTCTLKAESLHLQLFSEQANVRLTSNEALEQVVILTVNDVNNPQQYQLSEHGSRYEWINQQSLFDILQEGDKATKIRLIIRSDGDTYLAEFTHQAWLY